MSRLERSLVIIFFTGLFINFYLVGWNKGYDTGVKTKQSEDILLGKTICRYKDK